MAARTDPSGLISGVYPLSDTARSIRAPGLGVSGAEVASSRPDASDGELVRRTLAGSGRAFHDLVKRFERPVLTVIRRMVDDRQLAEDLAQETFVKAYRALGRYDPSRKLASWLFKIAHNTTLDHLRRRQLDTVPFEASSADGKDHWEIHEAPEDEAPDRRLEQRQARSALARALGRLKPSYREILLLRFQQGLAYREIADVMGLEMNPVKVQLHRARKLLAGELEGAGLVAPERFRGG